MKINILGEDLQLLREKALFWGRKKALMLSDVHLGKAEAFQKFGVPVPSAINQDDLHRLSKLIEDHGVIDVYILGDLIHAKNSWTEELFFTLKSFLEFHGSTRFHLLMGNHERGSLEFLRLLPLEIIIDDLEVAPFLLSHGHRPSNSKFTIQGHVHPVVSLGHGSTSIRLPCFVLDDRSLTLPSFGTFTGGHKITSKQNRRIFAVTRDITEV